MDDVKCTGEESELSSCSFSSWGITDCSHHEDVGVQCSPVRLWAFKNEVKTPFILKFLTVSNIFFNFICLVGLS